MEMTIGQTLLTTTHNSADKEAIIIGDVRATYGELNEAVNRRANALLELGVKKGDHVGTLSANCMELVETIYAIARIGAVIVPLNIRLSASELIYVVDHSDISTLVLQDSFEEIVREMKPSITSVNQLLYSGSSVPDGFIDFEAKTREQPSQMPEVEVKESDTATIVYTAGTTGRPKGVVATHKNWVWTITNFATVFSFGFQKVLTAYPLFHVGAFANLFVNIFSANTLVMLKRFDPKLILETIEKEGISQIGNPPTVYKMLLQMPEIEKYDLSSIRFLMSASESIPDETRNQLKKFFPEAGIYENYGMSESGGSLTTRDAKYTDSKPFSVGTPHPNVSVRVVDKEGNVVPPETVGEVVGRGPNIMKEYYKAPEKTAETIRGGWLYTGDLGFFDADGFLYIKERKNHMIISGGENIYPKEVEEVLYQHPKIVEVAVFGLKDDLWGEKVCAAVLIKPGEHLVSEGVIDFCKDKLASFKKPKEVYFMDALPKSPVGKILRTELKKQYSNT